MEKFIFEVIPPPACWEPEKIENWAKKTASFLKERGIHLLNIPEVVDETTRKSRTVPFNAKVDTLLFAKETQKFFPEIDPIINKISVMRPPAEFEEWAENAIARDNIKHLVLVGGEDPSIKYPGYEVTDATKFIKKKYPSVNVGGITIFTRPDEPERMLAKMENGISFFVSQIIFETANMVQVLTELKKLVDEEGREMPDIYISIAPGTRKKDIEFMKWLGVEFPSAILSYFMKNDENVTERTFEVITRVIDDLARFTKRTGVNLGINFEHVMYNNLDVTFRLIDRIRGVYILP